MYKFNFLAILICFFYSICSDALPIVGSPYFGGEGGLIFYSKSDNASLDSHLDILAGRIFVGYRFLSFFALEAGSDFLANTEFKGDQLLGPDHFKLNGYDLNAKLILPLVCGLDLYSQVGAVYLKQDAENIRLANNAAVYASHQTSLLPSIGAGVQYNFNRHFAMRLSWMHICGSDQIKAIDFIPLGIFISI